MRRLAVALGALALLTAFPVTPAQASLSVSGFSVEATEANGDPAKQAGSHPYALSTEAAFSGGDVRDLSLELPPGLIENPSAVSRCTPEQFETLRFSPHEASRSGESCPDTSQIGVIGIETPAETRYFGVFNLAPPPGHPSRFGAAPYGAPLTFTPQVRQAEGEYGLTLVSRRISQLVEIEGIELTLWGTPWAIAHNGERGNCLNESEPTAPHGACNVGKAALSYLSLPADCSAPMTFSLLADSWQQPGDWESASSQSAASLEDCETLPFSSKVSVVPTSQSVSSPTGLGLHLEASQVGLITPSSRLASQIKRTTLTLPEGVTINPSVGAGLGACTPSQYAAESATSEPGAGCPNNSKIGAATLATPLVEGELAGSLFIATPFANPFGSPYALYFIAKSAERGLIVKVAGRLDADPLSGRLTATFDNLPRLPYSNLEVDFREGQRAPLVTPAACGNYFAQIGLSPWAAPATSLSQTSVFQIFRGVGGGACPAGAAPFAPRATAGTINSNAGSSTSFYLHLTRGDAEQEITSYSTQLPPGLLGAIAGVPFCADVAIAAAKTRTGTAEAQSPSCPEASRIGRTYSGYGVGLAPAYAPGAFYLAGPYHGAPLSVVAINPAIVGPFDLGTVVIRSAIQVDPKSAQVTIDSTASDPIPHIFAGIPLRLRDVRVFIDRSDFMRNPTSCAPFSITSTMTGADVPFTNPRSAAGQATSPFQAFSCSSLGFAPKVALSLKGPTRRGGYQQLKVTVAPRPGDANIAAAAVTLPPSLFLAQNHIRGICTRTQFIAETCPGGSVIGSARAETPLLSEPLQGVVYLRSSENLLPDLVTLLRGKDGLRIVLECRIDSHRGGLRGTCEGLPDAPVSKFTMTLFGGKKRGILIAAESLCRKPQTAISRLLGHASRGVASRPAPRLRCVKARKKHESERRGRER